MGADFLFIHVKEPEDALQLAKEPEIRSHVTRFQWKKVEGRQKPKAKHGSGRRSLDDIAPHATMVNVRSTVSMGAEHDRNNDQPTLFTSIPPPIGGLRVDPFRSYPVVCKPLTPYLVDHCK